MSTKSSIRFSGELRKGRIWAKYRYDSSIDGYEEMYCLLLSLRTSCLFPQIFFSSLCSKKVFIYRQMGDIKIPRGCDGASCVQAAKLICLVQKELKSL